MVYAVIDTNIIVSSFITKNSNAYTRRGINSMLSGKIISHRIMTKSWKSTLMF